MFTTHLIIGMGEVGTALRNVLREVCKLDAVGIDKKEKIRTSPKDQEIVLHICFPYSRNFIKQVNKYIYKYNPKLVIIHSSVAVGTSDKLKAVYSPIRGVHPNLEKGIKTFVKYFGGKPEDTILASSYFKGIKTARVDSARSLEFAKLLCTTYYGWGIMFEKWVKEYCDKNNFDFNIVYKEFTETYNQGYKELGMENVCKPIYNHVEGPIGGHCVTNNCKILKDFEPSKIILKKNKNL